MDPNQNSTQSPPPVQSPQVAPSKTNGLAIAGFVLAFLLPLIGLILSIIGLVKAKDYNGNGQGLSIAGIVISVILIPISAIFFIAFVAGFSNAVQEEESIRGNTSSQIAPYDR